MTTTILKHWLESESMKIMDPRARIVHGVAFAGWSALVHLLESEPLLKQAVAFREFLVRHCALQGREVERQVNVNQFWTDLLSAMKSDAFGHSPADMTRLFKVAENPFPDLILPPEQLATAAESSSKQWKSLLLYFQPDPVINMIKEYKRRMGVEGHLDRTDLQAQMRTRPYWQESKHGIHRQRFHGLKGTTSCWCIDLDKHELGYQAVTPEEWETSLHPAGDLGLGVPSDEWEDPRRGDLFALVDALKGKE